MSHDVTNFLPHDKVTAFKNMYLTRLGVVVIIVVTFILVAHTALLLPSYLYLSEDKALQEARLEQLSASLSREGQEEISQRTAILTNTAERLVAFADTPTISDIVKAILSVAHPGVHLTGITADVAPGENRLQLSGVADSREALRTYHLALSALPYVATADLPLSAYAKETDIPFSIMVTGTLLP